jgi:hypothetical protein
LAQKARNVGGLDHVRERSELDERAHCSMCRACCTMRLVNARFYLTGMLMCLAACAAGEALEDTGNIFTSSASTTNTSMTTTMGNETDSGMSAGDGDGSPGDGDGSPGDGSPGDGDGDGGPAVCGDGVKQLGEECDGNDLGGADCTTFGFEEGTLVCADDCTLFTTACSTCGDGQLAATEDCDGNNFGGLTCVDLGFAGGTLSCSPDCKTIIQSGCMQAPNCGNGLLNPGEACDGNNLNGQTCQSLGYDGGTLACTPGCLLDTTGCTLDQCVGLLGACNILFDDCCDGLMCALAFCVPQ